MHLVTWYSMKVKVTQPCPTLRPHGLYSPWNSPGQNAKVGSLSLFQDIFPIQGWDPDLLHCRQTLYQLSHKGSQEYWSREPIPSPEINPGSPALQVDSLLTELSGKSWYSGKWNIYFLYNIILTLS